MKIKKHKNFKEALEDITKKDKEYVFVRHSLRAGREIKKHFHKKANEFLVIDSGKFKVELGKEGKTFNLKKQAISIIFPKNKKHSLSALSPISYFVIRDKKDISIYERKN